ncbi:MAG: LPS-assembly protein LptD, partial [Candidatus Omnitrophica bacterium]|nr:LPS-assembly protein LptD [Candidatus Omnitrophota bacterium]
TTCSYDKPHFRIQAKKVQFYPGDKVKAKDLVLYIGKVPVFYFPGFAKSLKDTVTPVQLQPGKNKDWGYYLLSGWRVNFTEKLRGRFLFDAREKLGTAQGFGLNYSETALGKGDFKFYYTHEKPDEPLADGSDEFERYLVRLRHIWQIDDANQITAEFYKIKDSKIKHDSQANFLKDYFYREFEKDQQPKTYLLYNHIFPNSSFNFFIQKRTTAFFEQIEKLPEASYILPAYQIGTTPLYFKTETSFSNLRNRGLEIIPSDDLISRFDTYNQLFLPFKLSFLNINPYVGLRETTYSRDINNDSIKDRTAFYSGAELSTKFFRAFSKGLRHIINPAIKYAYNSKPTVGRWRIIPFDSIDTLDSTNKLIFELSNILQAKKKDRTRNIAIFRVFTDYNFRRQPVTGKGFSDINYDLELHPFDWLGVESDGRYGPQEGYFKEVDVDLVTKLGNENIKDRQFSIGHHYERNGTKSMTSQLIWRVNPKWKFKVYERYQFSELRGRGLQEQEYSLSRDLHCWEFDITYNIRKDHGSTIWFIFRLKAFPEIEFDFNQSYNAPKTASAESP